MSLCLCTGWLVTAAAVESWTTRRGQGRTTHCTVLCSGPYANLRRGTGMSLMSSSSCRSIFVTEQKSRYGVSSVPHFSSLCSSSHLLPSSISLLSLIFPLLLTSYISSSLLPSSLLHLSSVLPLPFILQSFLLLLSVLCSSLQTHPQEPDLRYLVENIWGGQSVLSAVRHLFELVMVRWDGREQWSPWNCILLTKEEAQGHCRLENVHEVG